MAISILVTILYIIKLYLMGKGELRLPSFVKTAKVWNPQLVNILLHVTCKMKPAHGTRQMTHQTRRR